MEMAYVEHAAAISNMPPTRDAVIV